MNQDLKELFSRLTQGLSAEEVQLDTLQSQIAAQISMKRQELGLTQSQLAEKLAVTQTTVSKWENAESNFKLSTLVKIASNLGLKLQCPFAPNRPAVYAQSTGNILQLPRKADWHGIGTARPVYHITQYTEYHRKEA